MAGHSEKNQGKKGMEENQPQKAKKKTNVEGDQRNNNQSRVLPGGAQKQKYPQSMESLTKRKNGEVNGFVFYK